MIKIDNVPYMTVEEYALHKGKTIQTVYNWIKDKKVTTRIMMGNKLVKV